MSDFTQHSFFIKSGDHHLSATCFLPRSVRGSVLFVLPLVEERKGALPVFVQTARTLAARGMAGLLFDFGGCGDSSGDFGSVPSETFEADCETAFVWLKRMFPHAPQAVLGVRTGALLASRLASRHAGLAALALWSPVSGADLLRQLLQRRMVNDMVAFGKAQESRSSLEARLRNGETVDLDGYPISPAFYAWVQRLSLEQPPLPTYLATGGHDEKCAAGLAVVTRSELRHPPFWNTVGHIDLSPLIAETADWLIVRVAAQAASSAVPSGFCATAPLGELADVGPAPTVRMVLDVPAAAPNRGILFLHGWSGDRSGPHRLFVRFARQLAASGFLCARPDFVGRGLSDGDASDASISRMTDNAQAALNDLRRRLPPGAPIAIAAICSGCKVAIALTAKNQDIECLLLWSAESMGSLRSSATGFRKSLSALTAYSKKLMRPETWKKILAGNVQTGMVTKALVKHETRTPTEAAWEDAVLKTFRAYRHPILFVFGGSDPDAPGSSRAYSDFCRRSGIPYTLHAIAHAGHSYYGEVWTRELLEVSATFTGEASRQKTTLDLS